MHGDTILLLVAIALCFFAILYLIITQRSRRDDTAMIEWLKSMQQTIRSSTADTNTLISQRLDAAAMVIGELKKSLGEMTEIGRGMKRLQEFLQSPKLRGTIGEHILVDTISQWFPKQSFVLQYAFSSGEKVDVAIKTDAGILPVDAKFPIASFQKMHHAPTEDERNRAERSFFLDIKKHIDDIARKYIRPDEGTLDFALMYIPSEAVYYDVVNAESLMAYAKERRVYAVSPSTLYAHLQILLLSFQGKELERKTQDIMRILRGMEIDMKALREQYDILSRHIANAHANATHVGMMMHRLEQKIGQIHTLSE